MYLISLKFHKENRVSNNVLLSSVAAFLYNFIEDNKFNSTIVIYIYFCLWCCKFFWHSCIYLHCLLAGCVVILRSTVTMVLRSLPAWRSVYVTGSTSFLQLNGRAFHEMVSYI